MSWVTTFDEWMETAKEHLEHGVPVDEVLRYTWNTALGSGSWAIHDANPTTYPGREHTLEPNDSTKAAFVLAREAVESLKASKT